MSATQPREQARYNEGLDYIEYILDELLPPLSPSSFRGIFLDRGDSNVEILRALKSSRPPRSRLDGRTIIDWAERGIIKKVPLKERRVSGQLV